MSRLLPGIAKPAAIAAVIATVTLADAAVGTAHAEGGWLGLFERLWSRASTGNAEAALKRQGGSRLLLKLDTDALRDAVLIQLRDDARRELREARIAHSGLVIQDGRIEVRIRQPEDRQLAHAKLTSLSIAAAARDGTVAAAESGEGSIILKPTAAAFAARIGRARQQSIEVLERRLDNIGVTTRGVQPDGLDGIRIVLPGVKDAERVSAVFSRRAQITFRLVDVSMNPDEALRDRPPPGSEIVYELNTKIPLLLRKQVLLKGDDIADAAPGFDQRTNEPIVTFRFNSNGARRFAQVTQENIGQPFAIVLDNDVLSAPIIREPILSGSGQISGNFTVQDADAIAVLMRSGTLPGRLTVVEQQVVEPAY
jgi:preprotein translocase subunit SecD